MRNYIALMVLAALFGCQQNDIKPASKPSPKVEVCEIFEPIKQGDLEVIAALEDMPTIKEGKTANLKYHDATTEIWLKKDSTEFYIGVFKDGKWIDKENGYEY